MGFYGESIVFLLSNIFISAIIVFIVFRFKSDLVLPYYRYGLAYSMFVFIRGVMSLLVSLYYIFSTDSNILLPVSVFIYSLLMMVFGFYSLKAKFLPWLGASFCFPNVYFFIFNVLYFMEYKSKLVRNFNHLSVDDEFYVQRDGSKCGPRH